MNSQALRHHARCAAVHRGLNEAVKADSIDAVFCGAMMRNVWETLSLGYRGGYAGSAAEFESRLVAAIRAGDVIMVKGRLGSRMKPLSTRWKSTFPTKPHPTMWRRKVV
jgi:UDP-N-acetylmuramoyl-tripeptide--D-alanyl-D-alanine ligase